MTKHPGLARAAQALWEQKRQQEQAVRLAEAEEALATLPDAAPPIPPRPPRRAIGAPGRTREPEPELALGAVLDQAASRRRRAARLRAPEPAPSPRPAEAFAATYAVDGGLRIPEPDCRRVRPALGDLEVLEEQLTHRLSIELRRARRDPVSGLTLRGKPISTENRAERAERSRRLHGVQDTLRLVCATVGIPYTRVMEEASRRAAWQATVATDTVAAD